MSSSQRKTLLLSEDIHSLGSPPQLPDLSMARLETASTCLCCRSSHDGGHCAVHIGDSKLLGIVEEAEKSLQWLRRDVVDVSSQLTSNSI